MTKVLSLSRSMTTAAITLSRGLLRNRRCRWRLASTHPRYLSSVVELGALPPRLSPPPPLPPSSSSTPPPPAVSPNKIAKPTVDLRLPTKHSRKRLPTIITDYEELLSSAETILASNEGSLFTYDPMSAQIKHSIDHDRDVAWAAADHTVQTVEAILRGFAWHIPGTCWHRSLPPKDGVESMTKVPVDDIPIAMEELVDRLYNEGFAYMNLRAGRLQELHRNKTGGGDDDDVLAGLLDEPPPDDNPRHQPITFLQSGSSSENDVNKNNNADSTATIIEKNPYMHEFALPGPTTAMYDALLDVAAVTGNVDCLDRVNVWHELAFTRHQIDGGCKLNRNVYTVPTALTFNALIRYAANVPVVADGMDDLELRDTAVALAFSTYQTLDEIDIVHKNSASVYYTLQVIAKYMPPSRIRGNIAAGVFHQARYRGLVNRSVIDAYRAANTPSNSDEDDAYIRDHLSGPIPPKWKRDSKKYRFHPGEDVY